MSLLPDEDLAVPHWRDVHRLETALIRLPSDARGYCACGLPLRPRPSETAAEFLERETCGACKSGGKMHGPQSLGERRGY